MDWRTLCFLQWKVYQIRNAYCNPKPIQKPSPPILVGGSGERKTLKIVAKYADACNLFRSPETVRKKLDILKEHCKSVGRDYSSILKTKLSAIIVDDNNDMAKNRVRKTFGGIPEEQIKEFVIYGTPEDVSRQIEIFEQVGIQYLTVNLEPYGELEALNTFANKVINKISDLITITYCYTNIMAYFICLIFLHNCLHCRRFPLY